MKNRNNCKYFYKNCKEKKTELNVDAMKMRKELFFGEEMMVKGEVEKEHPSDT